jgi:hypothetical protein
MVINRKLKMGVVGGGPGAFIGEVHRKASRMDGQVELVAWAFDINPRKSKAMGGQLYLDPTRVYGTYTEMIEGESRLPDGERIDFVAVTTPNNWHFPIARDFLKAGFHVMCEKPMTMTSQQAKDLRRLVKRTGTVFGLMHNHVDRPMAMLRCDFAEGGELDTIRSILVEYPYEWLATKSRTTRGEHLLWGIDSPWSTDSDLPYRVRTLAQRRTHGANEGMPAEVWTDHCHGGRTKHEPKTGHEPLLRLKDAVAAVGCSGSKREGWTIAQFPDNSTSCCRLRRGHSDGILKYGSVCANSFEAAITTSSFIPTRSADGSRVLPALSIRSLR